MDAASLAPLGITKVPLEMLLIEADVVSMHCPLTPETRGMIEKVKHLVKVVK